MHTLDQEYGDRDTGTRQKQIYGTWEWDRNRYMGHGNGTETDKWDMGMGQEQINGTREWDRNR